MSGKILIQVRYLSHSSFLCETDQRLLLFDIGRVPPRPADCEPDLDALAASGKPILVFSSHDHADHFDPALKHWCDKTKGCRFLAGEFSRSSGNTIRIDPGQDRLIDDFRIISIPATDKGIAALFLIPDITLYFGGDHAIWDDLEEFRTPYQASVEQLARLDIQPDIAFIPVSTSDGWQEDALIEGCRLLMTRLKPGGVVPMHAYGYESFYADFAAKTADLTIPVALIRGSGDRFLFDGLSFIKAPSDRSADLFDR
jgi:L-ascorbate metabolism protein UlaG (beta-lactamase superfamily)